jgi:capsular exopolysaccharide synthesis family protein
LSKTDLPYELPGQSPNGSVRPKEGFELNFKRVLTRALKYWYFVVLSVIAAGTVAYLVNRYSPRIYPIKASIIILKNEENAGAQFLYKNDLVNPFRNFYNEIYIMKSYPLLTGVMEELNFDVSYFKEGNLRTTEHYDPKFPVEIRLLGDQKPYGRAVNFTVKSDQEVVIELLFTDPVKKLTRINHVNFGDTLRVNGYSILVKKRGDVTPLIGHLFLVRFNDPFSLARVYSNKLSAGWAQIGSSVVNLEVKGEIPKKEVAFLGKFIEKYQEYDVEKKNKMATMAIRFLNSQLHYMSDSLNMLEDRVESFKHKNVITNLGGETSRLYLKLEELEEQKFQYRLKENYFEYVIPFLQKEDYDGIFTPTSVGVTDNVVVELINSLISTRARMNSYQGVTNQSKNPLFLEQKVKLSQIKQDIIKTIENTRRTEAINHKFINTQIELIQQELRKIPGSEREFADLQRDYSLKEKLYIFLLQKRTEAGLSQASTTSDIVVVNPPLAGGRVSPKEDQNLMIGFALGLLLPFGVFVFIELINNKIQSREDIEKLTSVPVIGGVGHNITKEQMIVFNRPRSSMAESFRALRSSISYFTDNRSHLFLMVTSSLPGEGKSFTSLNLASVFAMAGKKTLILGADLRRPKLYDELKLNNDCGLSQYLSSMAELKDIIQITPMENLHLISAGPMPPNPSELLLRPQMENLVNELKRQYDYVIIDTPPLSYVADAFVLARFADHSIYVVRQDYTPKAALRSLDEYFISGKLENISVLFNDLRKSGPGYGYGYGYGYNYGYGYKYNGKSKSVSAGYYEE